MTELLRYVRKNDGRTYALGDDGHLYLQHPISGLWRDCGIYESSHGVTRRDANHSLLFLLGGLVVFVGGIGFIGSWLENGNQEALASEDDSSGVPKEVTKWRSFVEKHAGTNNLPPDLVEIMIWYESGGDPNEISASGAVGLMQVTPSDGDGIKFEGRPTTAELLDPTKNIKVGCRLLREKIDYYGSMYEGIKHYGPSPAYLAKKYGDEDYYVKKVLRIWEDYHPASYHRTDLY